MLKTVDLTSSMRTPFVKEIQPDSHNLGKTGASKVVWLGSKGGENRFL